MTKSDGGQQRNIQPTNSNSWLGRRPQRMMELQSLHLLRKGGALKIIQLHFKQAVGVAIVRGNVTHKLRRLHYACRGVLMRTRTQVGRTTLRTGGYPVKWALRQRTMQHINSSGMDSTLVCSDTPQKHVCHDNMF